MKEISIRNGYYFTACVFIFIFALALFPFFVELYKAVSINFDVPIELESRGFGLWVMLSFFGIIFIMLFGIYAFKASLFREITNGKYIHKYEMRGNIWEKYRDDYLTATSKIKIFGGGLIGGLIVLIGIIVALFLDDGDEAVGFFLIMLAVGSFIFITAYLSYKIENAKFNTENGIFYIAKNAVIINNSMTIINSWYMSSKIVDWKFGKFDGITGMKLLYKYKDYRNTDETNYHSEEILLPFESKDEVLIEKITSNLFGTDEESIGSEAIIADEQKKMPMIVGYAFAFLLSAFLQIVLINQYLV